MSTMPEHECQCVHDDPSLAVMSQKTGDQHIGVRFWDAPVAWSPANDTSAYITVDGMAQHGVFEAILGEEGIAWRFREGSDGATSHLCLTCRRGLCIEKLTGKVELVVPGRQGQ
jgi:hypothetical protein